MRILGIDPGLQRTGFAVLEAPDNNPSARPIVIDAGIFRFTSKDSIPDRLVQLEDDLRELIAATTPTHGAVEAIFSHYAHPRTAITMAHGRGVILLTLQRFGLDLIELPPNEVKKATTGHGHASKHQVQHAVASILDLPEPPSPSDVADAMAIALTAAQRLHHQRVELLE